MLPEEQGTLTRRQEARGQEARSQDQEPRSLTLGGGTLQRKRSQSLADIQVPLLLLHLLSARYPLGTGARNTTLSHLIIRSSLKLSLKRVDMTQTQQGEQIKLILFIVTIITWGAEMWEHIDFWLAGMKWLTAKIVLPNQNL